MRDKVNKLCLPEHANDLVYLGDAFKLIAAVLKVSERQTFHSRAIGYVKPRVKALSTLN